MRKLYGVYPIYPIANVERTHDIFQVHANHHFLFELLQLCPSNGLSIFHLLRMRGNWLHSQLTLPIFENITLFQFRQTVLHHDDEQQNHAAQNKLPPRADLTFEIK